MKKLYTLICATALTLISLNASATMHYVIVGMNSTGPANAFNPTNTAAVVGDSVTFVLGANTHNVTSGAIPGGATSFASGNMSTPGQTFVVGTLTVAGVYNFSCTLHTGMNGTITVTSSSGIAEPTLDLLTSAYPNPFKDKITLKYGAQISSIKIFNVIGEEVRSIELPSSATKTEIDFEGAPTGIYFIRTYHDGAVIETKKIVKTK